MAVTAIGDAARGLPVLRLPSRQPSGFRGVHPCTPGSLLPGDIRGPPIRPSLLHTKTRARAIALLLGVLGFCATLFPELPYPSMVYNQL